MRHTSKMMGIVMKNRAKQGWPGGDMVAMAGYIKALEKQLDVNTKKRDAAVNRPVYVTWNINYPWGLDHLIEARLAGAYLLVFALNVSVNDKKFQRFIASEADGIIFLSREEQDAFEEYVGIKVSCPAYFCGIGVNTAFETKVINDKEGVLCVGRIEPRKNQLRLIKACLKQKLPLTLVGKVTDEEYFQQCLLTAKKSDLIAFLDFVSGKKLRELYKKAKVIAHVATLEPWGLTIREGALYNCNILMTNNTYCHDPIPQLWWCNPYKQEEISEQLSRAYMAEPTFDNRDYVKAHYSWDVQVDKLLKIISQVRKNTPKSIQAETYVKLLEPYAKWHQEDERELVAQKQLVNELYLENIKKQQSLEYWQKENIAKQQALEHWRNDSQAKQQVIDSVGRNRFLIIKLSKWLKKLFKQLVIRHEK